LERTLFFTRLSPQISTQLLASKFQECPGFVDAATSGNKNGNGFVDFDNKANALMALSKFDGTILLDTELRISLQPPPGAVVPDLEPPESWYASILYYFTLACLTSGLNKVICSYTDFSLQ
jgi:RNA recognition motif-containing protein